MPTVVIAPYNVAAFPEGGGFFWLYLQYVLGFRQLGWEVYWLEAFRTKGRAQEEAAALDTFRARMEQYGLGGKSILYLTHSKRPPPELPAEYLTMSRDEAEAVYERADLLLNFHYGINPTLLARFRRTVLVDIDPGLLQFWISRGQISVPRHDMYFTTAEGVGRKDGKIPDCGLTWIQIRPCVCLEHWPYVFDAHSEAFTTVSLWDSGDWVRDSVETYENTKRVAFLDYTELPRLTNSPLELALFLRRDRDNQERGLLESRGWRIRHSRDVAGTPETYRSYIQQARGEFSCAKPSYMKLQTAWVSDRSVCFLASGKPVVVQHTGPSAFLPNGEGMFRFSTLKEAADALAAINADYERHCRAARKLAETYFDARQVVEKIVSHALKEDPAEANA